MHHIKYILLTFLATLMAAGCNYPAPAGNDRWNTNDDTLDTVAFVRRHHYGTNFNFKVTADSLCLVPARPDGSAPARWADTVTVWRGDKLVVADIALTPNDTTDSVWVKVARDQLTMGWIGEQHLTKGVVPDDPISQFIHAFSSSRTIVVIAVAGLAVLIFLIQAACKHRLRMVHFNDIDSFYPTLLCLTVSGAATLYGSMQHFVPETWVEFYHHPTLNPFGLPLVLAVFVSSVWLMLVTALAALDDIRRHLDWTDIPAYVVGLAAACTLLYLFFSLSTPSYVGYPCLIAYWTFAIVRYAHRHKPHYVCGRCGAVLSSLGRCPRCGAVNRRNGKE